MDKTKQKIQELVPSIMELKFGCRFFFKGNNNGCVALSNGEWKRLHFLYKPLHLEPKYDTLNRQDLIDDNALEILGRPITLADVLLAIKKQNPEWRPDDFFKATGSIILPFYDISWDLTKSYDDQSQETKDFIGSILGV